MNLTANEIMAFIPAQGSYEEALAFYDEIGFTVDYTDDSISIVRKDECRFFLQNVSWEGARDNYMMSLKVDDLDAWWRHLDSLDLPSKYPNVKLRDPEDYPWGMREIQLIDPCGVLWHMAVPIT